MKKKIIYLFIMIFIASCYAKTVTIEDGYLSLEIPEECGCIDIDFRDGSKLQIRGICIEYISDKINYVSEKFGDFLVEQKYKYDRKIFENYLLQNNFPESDTFAFSQYYHRYSRNESKEYIGYLPKSYKPIIMDDILGEEYFWLPVKYCIYNEYRATGFSYHITFALPDRLERISFGINSIDYSAEELVNSFPQWFEMRKDGLYYWINQACLDAMYDLLFSDDYKKLPRDLQLIRETRDMILQTVRINNPPVDTSKLKEGVITG